MSMIHIFEIKNHGITLQRKSEQVNYSAPGTI